MSHKVVDWVWTQPVKGVQQHVLLAIANRHNAKTGQCNPTVERLVEDTGLGESTIRRAIRELNLANIILVSGKDGGRSQAPSYVFPTTVATNDGRPFRRSVRFGNTPLEERFAEAGSVWSDDLLVPGEGPATLPKVSRSGSQRVSERDPSSSERVSERAGKGLAARDAVLRTRTREVEPGSTSAAVASADEQATLFPVDRPASSKPGRSLAVVQRKELAQANAGHAVAAWCEGYAETHDAKPTARQIGQVGREARYLFEAGNSADRVVHAARSAGRRGLATVEKEHNALSKRANVPVAAPPRPSTADQRVAAGLEIARRLAEQERNAG